MTWSLNLDTSLLDYSTLGSKTTCVMAMLAPMIVVSIQTPHSSILNTVSVASSTGRSYLMSVVPHCCGHLPTVGCPQRRVLRRLSVVCV